MEYLSSFINDYDYVNKMGVVSEERIREEMLKCFHFNSFLTIETLNRFPSLKYYIFTKTKIWLKPTIEK